MLAVIALLALTAGCATTRTVDADIKQHCNTLYANPQIDPVRSKILLPITYGAGQPIEILADRTTPAGAERPALLAVSKAFEGCNQYAVEKLGPMPSYRVSSNDRVNEALSRLYADELTFGGFAKEMLYIGERDQLASEDLSEALRAQERWGDN
jgi:predicted small secreted protein